MAGFIQLDAAQARGVAILHIDQSARDTTAQQTFDGAGHAGARLPCSDHLNAIELRESVAAATGGERFAVEAQVAEHGLLGISGVERGAEDLDGVFAAHHFLNTIARRRTEVRRCTLQRAAGGFSRRDRLKQRQRHNAGYRGSGIVLQHFNTIVGASVTIAAQFE